MFNKKREKYQTVQTIKKKPRRKKITVQTKNKKNIQTHKKRTLIKKREKKINKFNHYKYTSHQQKHQYNKQQPTKKYETKDYPNQK